MPTPLDGCFWSFKIKYMLVPLVRGKTVTDWVFFARWKIIMQVNYYTWKHVPIKTNNSNKILLNFFTNFKKAKCLNKLANVRIWKLKFSFWTNLGLKSNEKSRMRNKTKVITQISLLLLVILIFFFNYTWVLIPASLKQPEI